MKWVSPLAILLVAFALRLYLLADSNIWYDEGLAVWAARQSLPDSAAWTSADVHPPLYFWFLHFWRGLVGDSEFAVRWLSVAFGLLAVAVTYTLARSLFKGRGEARSVSYIAWGAMALLALSRFHIWWSQEARMYVLGSLLVALSLYFTVKLRQRFTFYNAVGYLVVTVAALYTLYLLAFLLVIEGLYWLATLPRTRALWRSIVAWGLLQLIALAAFAPWLLYALPRMNQWSVQVAFDGGQFARLYATLLTLGISTDIERVTGLVLLLIFIVIGGVGVAWWRTPAYRSGLLLLLLAILIPPLIVWGATTFPRAFGYSPKPEARYFIPYLPAFAVLGSMALTAIGTAFGGRQNRQSLSFQKDIASNPIMLSAIAVTGALVVGVHTWTLQEYYHQRLLTDEYRSITSTMHAYWREGDGVLLHSDQPWPVFAYHWTKAWDGVTYTQEVQPDGTLSEVYPLWESHSALWLVVNEDAQRIDPQGQVESWLERNAVLEQEWRFGKKRLVLFVRVPERISALGIPLSVTNGVPLPHWEQPLQRVRPGTLTSYFYTARFEQTPMTMTLILGNSATPIATTTSPVTDSEVQRLQFDLLIPPDTPAATYPLSLHDGNTLSHVGDLTVLSPINPVSANEMTTLPATARATNAVLGKPPLIALRGYENEVTPLHAGDTLPLTLYWQAEQPISLPYKVFVHFSVADEVIWAQSDSEPTNGNRPTTSWQVGELIADSHTLSIDPATPPGRYTVWVGLYDPATGERLSVLQTEIGNPQVADRIKIMEIEVQ
jgi:mannosyltransferase